MRSQKEMFYRWCDACAHPEIVLQAMDAAAAAKEFNERAAAAAAGLGGDMSTSAEGGGGGWGGVGGSVSFADASSSANRTGLAAQSEGGREFPRQATATPPSYYT